MKNKILAKIYVPNIDKEYEIWLPINNKIDNIVNLLLKIINQYNCDNYKPIKKPHLYDKSTAKQYEGNLTLKELNIENGAELILI